MHSTVFQVVGIGENMRCHSDRGLVRSSICLVCFSSWVDNCIIIVSDRVLASLASSSWDNNTFSRLGFGLELVWVRYESSARRIISALVMFMSLAFAVALSLISAFNRIVNWMSL